MIPKRPANEWIPDSVKKTRAMVIHDLIQYSDTAHATFVYLEGSDEGFRHDRINAYVTLYRALDDDRIVGFMVGDR